MKVTKAIEAELIKALAPEEFTFSIGYGADLDSFVANRAAQNKAVFINYDGFRGLEYTESYEMIGYQRDIVAYIRVNKADDIESLSEKVINHFWGGGGGVPYIDNDENEHRIGVASGTFSEEFGRGIFEISFVVV